MNIISLFKKFLKNICENFIIYSSLGEYLLISNH